MPPAPSFQPRSILLLSGIIGILLSTMSNSKTSYPVPTAHALSQSIVVIGLNAALQKRFILAPKQNLEPGNVHRAQSVEIGVGGKGQDVGVAMSCLMSNDSSSSLPNEKVLLAQFLGAGPEGDLVSQTLSSKHQLSEALTIRNSAPLRTCTTIVGADCATELVEPSGNILEEELEELREKVGELTKEDGKAGGKASGVCVMGSMPPGCPEDTYADLMGRLASKDSLVLIDSVIGLESLLGVLKGIFGERDDGDNGGAVLKLNAAELCKLAGVSKSPGGEADRVTLQELNDSTQQFIAKFGDAVGALDYLCITDGKYPGYLIELPNANDDANFRTWQMPAVDLSEQAKDGMLYPIGAGDTVAAGTLAAWQYLQHSPQQSENTNFFGVVPNIIGSHLSKVEIEWGKAAASNEEKKGIRMATAFAFGLSCGSASCLKQENSVFDGDDALKFFGGMERPAFQLL